MIRRIRGHCLIRLIFYPIGSIELIFHRLLIKMMNISLITCFRELLQIIPESTLSRMGSIDKIGGKMATGSGPDRLSEEISAALVKAGQEQLEQEIDTLKEINREVDEGLRKRCV